MKTIGIIANPASGKDIRRLVSHATVVDNNEKINIVKRIILASQGTGVEHIYIMPDTFLIGHKAIEDLTISKELKIPIDILDMKVQGNLNDTIRAAELLEKLDVGVIVVLGGDGTLRAVAKGNSNIPIIGISTGTNNVYPKMIEGTVAGMAASAIATNMCDKDRTCIRDKRIEIYKESTLVDIALVDCVISKQTYVGSRAIWKEEDIVKVIVSNAHPAAIGFSTIVGVRKIISDVDDFGASVNLNVKDEYYLAPIAAGTMKKIRVDKPTIHKIDERFDIEFDFNGIMALDGEREIPFKIGESYGFKITRNGPIRVNVRKAIESTQEMGFFVCK